MTDFLERRIHRQNIYNTQKARVFQGRDSVSFGSVRIVGSGRTIGRVSMMYQVGIFGEALFRHSAMIVAAVAVDYY